MREEVIHAGCDVVNWKGKENAKGRWDKGKREGGPLAARDYYVMSHWLNVAGLLPHTQHHAPSVVPAGLLLPPYSCAWLAIIKDALGVPNF
jgi:hypothetical protein